MHVNVSMYSILLHSNSPIYHSTLLIPSSITITVAVPTGTTAVLVHGGERSLVANLAAANTFAHTHMETPQAKAMVARAHIYYSAGFFLTVSVDSMLAVAKESVAHNKTYCLNLSAPFIIQFYKDQLRSMMPYADYLFGNESEAAAYGESMGYGHDISTIALKVRISIYTCIFMLYICIVYLLFIISIVYANN
jgi:sugar/nucleoside kinase (ribokinase family)